MTDNEMTDEQYNEAMEEFSNIRIAEMIGTVLEMLTMYAVEHGSYYITAEDNKAMTIITVDDDVQELLDLLPSKYKSWEEILDNNAEEFISNADPGDEQNESAAQPI